MARERRAAEGATGKGKGKGKKGSTGASGVGSRAGAGATRDARAESTHAGGAAAEMRQSRHGRSGGVTAAAPLKGQPGLAGESDQPIQVSSKSIPAHVALAEGHAAGAPRCVVWGAC